MVFVGKCKRSNILRLHFFGSKTSLTWVRIYNVDSVSANGEKKILLPTDNLLRPKDGTY